MMVYHGQKNELGVMRSNLIGSKSLQFGETVCTFACVCERARVSFQSRVSVVAIDKISIFLLFVPA